MLGTSRVPLLRDSSFSAMNEWFAEMAEADLLFHPDDAPENIIRIVDGTPTFSASECAALREIIDLLFSEHGDLVYTCGLAHAQRALGLDEQAH